MWRRPVRRQRQQRRSSCSHRFGERFGEARKIGKASLGEPTDASLSALLNRLHVFRHTAASPGSEPELLSAAPPRSALKSHPIAHRTCHRTVWPPFMKHRLTGNLMRIAAARCHPDDPRGKSGIPRDPGAGERPKRIVRLASAEPFALSRTRRSPKKA